MTGQEWAAFEQYLDASWPRPALTDEVAAAYRAELGGLDPDVALAATRAAALRGNPEFRPSPLSILAAVEVQAPTVDDALRLFRRALTRGKDDGMRWLAETSVPVALFVSEIGWGALRLERVDDPDVGGVVRSRLASTLSSCARDAAADPQRAARLLEERSHGRRLGLRPAGDAIRGLLETAGGAA